MPKNEFGFKSARKGLLSRYIHERRLCGYECGPATLLRLKGLDRFLLTECGRQSVLGRKEFERFVAYRKGESGSMQTHRASTWRQFALFCRRQGMEAYVPEERSVPIGYETCSPYIFSRGELASLFDAVDRLPYRKSSPRRIPNLQLLFRVLYGTGMRLGEALGLTIGDLDRESAVLTVRQGKNRKDRLVPLTSGLAKRVIAHVDRYPSAPDTPLFLSPCRMHAIDQMTVESPFREQILPLAGLPPRAKRRGPRIHDLRHTFAVHRMEKWFLAGEDVEAKLPYLAAYMGHTSVRETYYYLRITASFFPEITRRFELRAAGIIPERGRP